MMKAMLLSAAVSLLSAPIVLVGSPSIPSNGKTPPIPSAGWEVSVRDGDELSTTYVCRRTAEKKLECGDLGDFLAMVERLKEERAAKERREREARAMWQGGWEAL